MPRTPFSFGIALMALLFTAPAHADEAGIKGKARAFTEAEVTKWAADAVVIAAINAANSANAGYDQAKVEELDGEWRAEVGAAARPLIDAVMANPASARAKSWCDGFSGLVTEIILMDNKGLDVGICNTTSDYWQGDEPKYLNTFAQGAGAVFIDELEQDSSTRKFQVQSSMTVIDPASGQPIGAITVGLDAMGLMTQ